MSAVQDPVHDHNDHSYDNQQDHVFGVLVLCELLSDVTFIALHVGVEEEDIRDQNDLDCGHIDVQVFAWFLLFYLWEESVHEGVVVDEPLHPLESGETARTLTFVPVDNVVL